MNTDIFNYSKYRSFLTDNLAQRPNKGHGLRSQWAKAMGCQVAFVSHVLNGHYELSLEQAEGLARHLALNKEEKEFFLLLVQKERAATQDLKKHFTELISEKTDQQQNIRHRMKIKTNLSIEDQALYYSSWLYSAVHIILTIPEFQSSTDTLATYFNQPLVLIRKILEFLETRQIIELNNGRYLVKNNFQFINKDSPLFAHQQNFWRQKAIEAIYRNNTEEIHFSSIFTLAERDVKKIKDILLKSIQDSTEVIKPSKEEKLYSICMDFFEVK